MSDIDAANIELRLVAFENTEANDEDTAECIGIARLLLAEVERLKGLNGTLTHDLALLHDALEKAIASPAFLAENERLRHELAAEREESAENHDLYMKAVVERDNERERAERLGKALQRYVDTSDGCDYGGGEQCPGTPNLAPCRYHEACEALRPGVLPTPSEREP